jgi:hypothetical protein
MRAFQLTPTVPKLSEAAAASPVAVVVLPVGRRLRVIVVGHEVPAVHVVDEAVAVIVLAVARDLAGVGVDVRLEVRVVEVTA